jgi:orotate phosphoribosyltransferase-like protein
MISEFKKKKIEQLKEKAWRLYQEGLTTREVGQIIGRSRQWVSVVVREKMKNLTKKDNGDKINKRSEY